MLNRKNYFIREHVGLLKISDTYDILDPETKQQIGFVKEKNPFFVTLLKFVVSKKILPTKVFVYEGDSIENAKLLFSIHKKISFWRQKVKIFDANGNCVGTLVGRFFRLQFFVKDSRDQTIGLLKGVDWKAWNFKLLDAAENEIGTVSKKWAGIGKELFTSADNYMVSLHQALNPDKTRLLLSAALAVDMVFKER